MPIAVPSEFVATSRNRYDVFGSSPVTTDDTEMGADPDPALVDEVEEPSAVLLPYSK